MSQSGKAYSAPFFCLFALQMCVSATPVSFFSGGDPTGSTQWNSVTGFGVPNLAIAAHPAWQPPQDPEKWVSFTDSGFRAIVLPNAGAFKSLGNPTASFFVSFFLPNPINVGRITVWADDTAAVYLNDVPSSPQLLYARNTSPSDDACVQGAIGCAPGEGGVVPLNGLSAGAHSLRIDAWQLGGDTFGVLYTGEIESITSDEPTPEPGTAAYLLLAFGATAAWRRFRVRPTRS